MNREEIESELEQAMKEIGEEKVEEKRDEPAGSEEVLESAVRQITGDPATVGVEDIPSLSSISERLLEAFEACTPGDEVALESAYIFGSFAAGDAREGESDLDVLVTLSNTKGDELDPKFDVASMGVVTCLNERQEIVEGPNEGFIDGIDIIKTVPQNEQSELERLSRGRMDGPDAEIYELDLSGEPVEEEEVEEEEETQEEEGEREEPEEDPREAAERIVEEEGIEATDYIVYQSKMDSLGFERETTREVWQQLREDGVLTTDKDHPEEGVHEKDMSPPELGEVDPNDIAEIHLFVVDDCPACEAAKTQMSPNIDEGHITVQDISNDEEAVEIAEMAEIEEAPILVAELKNGEFREM